MNRMILESMTDSEVLLLLRQSGSVISLALCLTLALFKEPPRFYSELIKAECQEKCSNFNMVPISVLILMALFINVILRYWWNYH